MFDDYAGRLEHPNQAQRWDKPLFQLQFDEKTPVEDIAKACLQGKKPRTPVSTKPEELFDENFLTLLDKSCTSVNTFIIAEQGNVSQGSSLGLPKCPVKYRVARHMNPIELKRFKKDFLNMSKLNPPKGGQKDGVFEAGYIEFLNARLNE
jgi:protein KTI12